MDSQVSVWSLHFLPLCVAFLWVHQVTPSSEISQVDWRLEWYEKMNKSPVQMFPSAQNMLGPAQSSLIMKWVKGVNRYS